MDIKTSDLIRQPHGGALRPFTAARGAAARRSSMRAIRKEALALLAEATPEASRRLVSLLASEDERVAAVAASQILDRVLGKPSEARQAADDGRAVDIAHLTLNERNELSHALATIYRLTGVGPGALADE